MKRLDDRCIGCAKLHARGYCEVFTEHPKNWDCYTTDKDWKRKVEKAVEEYMLTH